MDLPEVPRQLRGSDRKRCRKWREGTVMDMVTLRLESREGDRVRHVPPDAFGNAEDPLCQDGTISRFDGGRVLVKFDSHVEASGWESAQETACDPGTLLIL